MTATNYNPISLVWNGSSDIFSGSAAIASGNIFQGMRRVFSGLTATNLGGHLIGLDPAFCSGLMKLSLVLGSWKGFFAGVSQIGSGLMQKNLTEITQGATRSTASAAIAVFLGSLDSRMLKIGHEALTVALCGSWIAKLGFRDLAKKRYLQGSGKILLGIGGIATAAYYFFSHTGIHKKFLSLDSTPLSANEMDFLQAHREEIEWMYKYREVTGNWSELGSGKSKITFEHPELPGKIIKIPRNNWGYREGTGAGEDDLKLDHVNLENLRSFAATFDRIALPQSHLFPTAKGLAQIQEKFNFVQWNSVPSDTAKEETLKQFEEFATAAGLCDTGHNGRFLSQTSPPILGLYDFDCVYWQSPIFFQNWDYKNKDLKFVDPEERNKIMLGLGAAALGGIAALAKKVSGTNPKTFLQLGLSFGILAKPYLRCINPIPQVTALRCIEPIPQPAAMLYGMGISLLSTVALTAVAIPVNKAYSWTKNYFLRSLPSFEI